MTGATLLSVTADFPPFEAIPSGHNRRPHLVRVADLETDSLPVRFLLFLFCCWLLTTDSYSLALNLYMS